MFDIGIKIVCIDDSFHPKVEESYLMLPVKDRIYTVRDIIPAHDYNGGNSADTCAVLLEEIYNPPNKHGVENGFAPRRFRELETDMEEISEKEVDFVTA